MPALATTVSPQARFYYLAISSIVRRHLSTSSRRLNSGTYHRSDFTNQGFTGYYEPGAPTEGPLSGAYTPPPITPSTLKAHLDAFVVGQERAKRTLATAVYNHYQRIQELQRREEEEAEVLAQEERRRASLHPRHPVEGGFDGRESVRVPALTKDWPGAEDEFPGQAQTTTSNPMVKEGWSTNTEQQQQQSPHAPPPLFDPTPLTLEKSNILLLGPSGVGKTLLAKTLARVLQVPFSISDCTPFTQAGYIGEDADVCVQRLLAAANYDVARAERGIICLDEVDKIATARVSHGKDVSGEGVQQALLKIIEGTTLQIQAKAERGNPQSSGGNRAQQSYHPPLGGSGQQSNTSGASSSSPTPPGGQKGEVYNVKTDNILFICAGAFNGLHKLVLDRISKGSIGFGAPIRAAPNTNTNSGDHETLLSDDEAKLFANHLPYYQHPSPSKEPGKEKEKEKHNALTLVEPQDLQKYGLIPELVGRLPISCALSALDIAALVQVLTEPRNSILKQYQQLFALSSIELRFTTAALHEVASTASKMGTGARGLRTVMERLLADAMFDTPGSSVKYVLVTEAVAKKEAPPVYFSRGQQGRFHAGIAKEEEAWEEKKRAERGEPDVRKEAQTRSFEEYREKVSAAGF